MVTAVFLELISAHKKSVGLQETSSEVSMSSAKPSAVGDDSSSLVKSDISTNESYSVHTTAAQTQTSVLPVPNSYAEYGHEGHLKKTLEIVDGVATNLPDDEAREMRKGDADNATCSSTDHVRSSDVLSEKLLETQTKSLKTSRNSSRELDVSSALAADMLSLYRNKVLAKNCYDMTNLSSSFPGPQSSLPATITNSTVKCSGILPYSGVMQSERKVVTNKPLCVSKSPFKLVKAKAVESSASRGNVFLPQVSESLQAKAHFDYVGCNIPRNVAQSLTSMSSFCHSLSRPCSTSVNTTRTVSCSSAARKNLTQQIVVTVSSNSNAVIKPNSCAIVSSSANFVREKNAIPKVSFTSSKYKLVRRKASVCTNTSRTSVIPLNDTVVPALGPNRDKHTLTSGQITVAVSSTADAGTKASSYATTSSSANFICEKNAHTKNDFTSSKYKLVRRRDSACRNALRQTSVIPLKDASITALGSHHLVRHSPTQHVVNKYKLVRKRLSSVRRTPFDVKKMAPSVNSSPSSMSTICENGLASDLKARSSRYKLVRRNDPVRSSLFKKPIAQLASNRVDDKVQVLSKYKLVRRRSNTSGTVSRTLQHAAPTPAVDSQQFSHPRTRSLSNKHTLPPLVLNKYKLIRKRAMLKTGCALRSPHCLTRSRKPSAERYKQSLYSRRRYSSAEMASPYKQRRKPRRQTFTSKYALQRSGKGR